MCATDKYATRLLVSDWKIQTIVILSIPNNPNIEKNVIFVKNKSNSRIIP